MARLQSSAFSERTSTRLLKLKAAALLHSIVTSRTLVDGNIAWDGWQTTVFLDVNGEPPDLGDDEAFQLVLSVAEGRIGVEDIADRLITEGGLRDRTNQRKVRVNRSRTSESYYVSRRLFHSRSTDPSNDVPFFPWSEAFDCIFRNEEVTGSNPVSSTISPCIIDKISELDSASTRILGHTRPHAVPQACHRMESEAPLNQRGALRVGSSEPFRGLRMPKPLILSSRQECRDTDHGRSCHAYPCRWLHARFRSGAILFAPCRPRSTDVAQGLRYRAPVHEVYEHPHPSSVDSSDSPMDVVDITGREEDDDTRRVFGLTPRDDLPESLLPDGPGPDRVEGAKEEASVLSVSM